MTKDSLNQPIDIGDVVLIDRWGLELAIVDSFTPKGYPRLLIKSLDKEDPHLYLSTYTSKNMILNLKSLSTSSFKEDVEHILRLKDQGCIQ